MTRVPEQRFWDGVYSSLSPNQVRYDLWLDKHQELLMRSMGTPILDLGCGAGNDTLYLSERGYSVIACDFSEEALCRLRVLVPTAEARIVDLTERLPFEDNSAQVIIADLSLHYFTWDQTMRTVGELSRILRPDGDLLCRVNSTRDIEYGAGQGRLLEPSYYEWQGQRKRFFAREDLIRLFETWKLTYIEEQKLHRYGKPKIAWELAARNNG